MRDKSWTAVSRRAGYMEIYRPEGGPDLRATLLPVLRGLEEGLPARLPVRLVVRRLRDCWGFCDMRRTRRDGPHFLVCIDDRSCEAMGRHTLAHEYAHALAWDEPGGTHSDAWGRAYAAVYRALEGEE